MVMIEGGCHHCGKLIDIHFEPNRFPENFKMICFDCNKKYYSKESIREKKLNKILKISYWEKIKSLFKK